jgi:hypothetical protein
VNSVGEHFVFLTAEARKLSGTSLLNRAVGVQVMGADILVAIDAAGEKHLLVPVGETQVAVDGASPGVVLGKRVLIIDGKEHVFADLHCRIPSLDLVFERLIEDVLSRIKLEISAPAEVCRQALDDWRTLLRTATDGPSREKIIGLVGELEVLRILASHSPAAALDAWRGPSKSVHDFVQDGDELEVKTTTSVAGNTISISNIDQLDPSLVNTLHLIVVHAIANEASLNLDDRIDQLISMGVPRGELLKKVDDAGYIYESGSRISDRYEVRSVRAWPVNEAFPGLRAGDIPGTRIKGVSKIKYELNLDSAPEPLTVEEFELLLSRWLVTDK